jgi:hypothetical protein
MSTRTQFIALIILAAVVALVSPKDVVLNASNVTIISIGPHQLVVSRTLQGKTEQLHFRLGPDTVRTGDLSVGSRVTVHYTTRRRENFATSIQALKSR